MLSQHVVLLKVEVGSGALRFYYIPDCSAL